MACPRLPAGKPSVAALAGGGPQPHDRWRVKTLGCGKEGIARLQTGQMWR